MQFFCQSDTFGSNIYYDGDVINKMAENNLHIFDADY